MAMKKVLIGSIVLAAVMLNALIVAADSGKLFIGSKADIAALKAAAQRGPGENVSGAHVVGNYAVLQWNDQYASNPEAYKRVSGEHWKEIANGSGGPLSQNDIRKAGVPQSIARQLCSGWPKGYNPCGGN